MLDVAVDGTGGESEAPAVAPGPPRLDSLSPDSGGPGSRGPAAVSGDPLTLDSLKALAHPLRVRILHVLTTRGPQTSSSLAAELGESTGSTSYHLRQLAAKGYLAEDPSLGTGRERWWRRAVAHVEVWTKELADAPEGRAASATVLGAWTQHDSALLAAYIATGEERYAEPVLDASRITSHAAALSASELHRLTRDVEVLIRERIAEAAARGAEAAADDPVHRIQIQFNAFPID